MKLGEERRGEEMWFRFQARGEQLFYANETRGDSDVMSPSGLIWEELGQMCAWRSALQGGGVSSVNIRPQTSSPHILAGGVHATIAHSKSTQQHNFIARFKIHEG